MQKKKKNKKFWQFKAATEDKPAELLLYGDISDYSWWGDEITPKQFKEDLDALGDVDEIHIHINSGGGDVFAGQSIRSILKRHKAYKVGYVDGLAASIASVILTACDHVIMPKNAMQMVHKAWSWFVGNADDFRKMAEDMDKVDESIVAAYEEKTGLDREKIIELMSAETWMTAEEAVEYGFADEIEESKQVAASLKDGFLFMNGQAFDLGRFRNPPKMDHLPVDDSTKGPQDQQIQMLTLLNEIKTMLNEGKTLSSANEERLRQARQLLDEVLDQLPENSIDHKGPPDPPESPAKDQQTEDGLFYLYQAKIQVNKNRRGY